MGFPFLSDSSGENVLVQRQKCFVFLTYRVSFNCAYRSTRGTLFRLPYRSTYRERKKGEKKYGIILNGKANHVIQLHLTQVTRYHWQGVVLSTVLKTSVPFWYYQLLFSYHGNKIKWKKKEHLLNILRPRYLEFHFRCQRWVALIFFSFFWMLWDFSWKP